MFDDSDPEMQRAYENARANFRYFWREVAWERRRIVPALDLACVKAPFSDGPQGNRTNPDYSSTFLYRFQHRVEAGKSCVCADQGARPPYPQVDSSCSRVIPSQ